MTNQIKKKRSSNEEKRQDTIHHGDVKVEKVENGNQSLLPHGHHRSISPRTKRNQGRIKVNRLGKAFISDDKEKCLDSPPPISRSSTPNSLASAFMRTQSPDMKSPLFMGKVIYFLDQMKNEVIEADKSTWILQNELKQQIARNLELQNRKEEIEKMYQQQKSLKEETEENVMNLQSDMKLLWEKNKELETRNIEMEEAFCQLRDSRDNLEEELVSANGNLAFKDTKIAEFEKWVAGLESEVKTARQTNEDTAHQLRDCVENLKKQTIKNKELKVENVELEKQYCEERNINEHNEKRIRVYKKKVHEMEEADDDDCGGFQCGEPFAGVNLNTLWK